MMRSRLVGVVNFSKLTETHSWEYVPISVQLEKRIKILLLRWLIRDASSGRKSKGNSQNTNALEGK